VNLILKKFLQRIERNVRGYSSWQIATGCNGIRGWWSCRLVNQSPNVVGNDGELFFILHVTPWFHDFHYESHVWCQVSQMQISSINNGISLYSIGRSINEDANARLRHRVDRSVVRRGKFVP
jgi:hypothetical protein